MGLWAEVKRTLNSTLGTTDFKPLDKIIEGQRTLAASDSVIQVIQLKETNIGTTIKEFGKFVPKVNGSVRIIADVRETSGTPTVTIKVLKNGVQVASKAQKINDDTKKIITLDVPISMGEEYSVGMLSTNNYSDINSISIGANIVDTSLVEVL